MFFAAATTSASNIFKQVDPWILCFSFITVVVTIWMGFWSARRSKTTSDFFVAGPFSVSAGGTPPRFRANTFHAASFMGVAGMVMRPVTTRCGIRFVTPAVTVPSAVYRGTAAAFRRLYHSRFCGRPLRFARLSQNRRHLRPLHRLFLHHATNERRGHHPGLYFSRPALLGRRRPGGGAVITFNVALGRHERHHPGAGVPILGQDVRYLRAHFRPDGVFMADYREQSSGKPNAPILSSAEVETRHSVRVQRPSRKELPPKARQRCKLDFPFGPLTTKAQKPRLDTPRATTQPYSLLYTYSLIIALVCGTAGLAAHPRALLHQPGRRRRQAHHHVGDDSHRRVLHVSARVRCDRPQSLPELYAATGAKGTDKIVLELPRILNEQISAPSGSILSGITCAGAFAAFMSTFSGLLVSMTGALAHDVYGRMLRPQSTPEQRMQRIQVRAVIIGVSGGSARDASRAT